MKLWFVKSATADNYILAETDDGLFADSCAPDGCFAGISLCNVDEMGNEISGEVIAERIAKAIDPDLSDADLSWMGEPILESFEAWEADQANYEPFTQDEAFPI